MNLEDLTDSAQNYLKSLWTLSEWTGGTVTPSEVARHLDLRPSSVSDQIRRLTLAGLVDHAPYGSVTLTEEGRALALQMVRRHRLAETFLAEMLGYEWDEVHEDADRLEHAISERMLERIDAALGHPELDPHGDPIPSSDGGLPDRILRPLVDCSVGDHIQMSRIRDADPAVLRHLGSLGIVPGAEFAVTDTGATSGVMLLRSGAPGHDVPLARDIAASIRVLPVSGQAADGA